MMTDPIADMLTRMRNAAAVHKVHVDMPLSKLKKSLAELLAKEGYLAAVEEHPAKRTLRVILQYTEAGDSAIRHSKRMSTPGHRLYVGKDAIPRVLGGIGLSILSTSKGLMTDTQARKEGMGGELICEIY